MFKELRHKIKLFFESEKDMPILAAIAASIYPLSYYYSNNFTLINSWNQFFFLLITYTLIPIVVFYVGFRFVKKTAFLKKYREYVLPVFNLCLFAILVIITTQGFKKRILALALICAFLLGVILKKHLKKIIVFQFLLALLALFSLIPILFRQINYSDKWMEQPDNILSAEFKKKPNVYVIQPDGYANFSELKKGYYQYDNSDFESTLKQKGFSLYEDFRSNYYSTLSSNTSMFAMKHHYFLNPKKANNELLNSREIIVGNNPVLSIFENNNYKTHLILEWPYFLANRPKLEYDFCNFSMDEISFFSRGFDKRKNVKEDLKHAILGNKETNNFYFIESLNPGHIPTYQNSSSGKEQSRLDYLEKLQEANIWLKQLISIIQTNDKNSLIILVADHGGFVGMDYTLQCKEKQTNRDLVYTIFTSALAIKWSGEVPDFDIKLKTNVNLFRILFSYLSDDKTFLDNIQDDKSYQVVTKGAPSGVYELIDENGDVVFEKVSNNLHKK